MENVELRVMAKNKNTVVELVETTTEIEAPYELPEGWKWCRLQDCSSIISKGTTPKGGKDAYVENGINFLRIENLNDDGSINLENISHITLEEHTNYLKRSILEEGDLLISIAGTLGKVGFVEKKDLPINTNQAIAFVRLYKNLFNNMYLKYAIESPFINAELISKTKVTSIPNLTLDIISNCTIPLPPTLEEQQRIVNRIETLFAKLDQAKEKAQNVVDTFEIRKASILHKAFTGELTKKWREENGVGDDSWEEKTLEECGKWERGRSKHRPRNAPELFGGKYPFIQTGDVANADVYINEHKQTLSEFGFKQSRLFPAGTLCITIAANIGKVAILSYDCCFPDSVVGFTPNENNDSKFMYYKINEIEKELEELAPATAQKNLNLKLLTSVKLKVPTLSEQQEIVRILDCVLEKENQAKEAAIAVLEQIDLLKKSILARAFRGEL